MTADEKNHVISNANEELDRQIIRLDTVFPYIAGEISEEARLGSMTHWAYSNKSTAKAATNERPRREAVSQRQDIAYAIHEAEAASRSEARREAVQARKQRRPHADADYEEPRGARKTNTGKSRGDNATADQTTKRRKVERPSAMEMGTPMERTGSGATSQRASAKDGAEKKRSRVPNPNAAAARKKYVSSQLYPMTHIANGVSSSGPTPHPMLDHPCWPPLLLSELSMPHGELQAQAKTHLGHRLHEPSKMPDKQAMPANGPRHRLPVALANQMLQNRPILNLHPVTHHPSKTKQATEMEIVIIMARQAYEQPLQEPPDVMKWMADRPTQLKPRPPKGEIPKRRHRYSPRLQKPPSPVPGPREVQTQRRNEIPRKLLLRRYLSSPPTRNPFMKATTRTRKASPGTATVTKSASEKWWLAIMTLVRGSGSICLVWECSSRLAKMVSLSPCIAAYQGISESEANFTQ